MTSSGWPVWTGGMSTRSRIEFCHSAARQEKAHDEAAATATAAQVALRRSRRLAIGS